MCKSVFTHSVNKHIFQPKQKKTFAQEQSSIPGGLIGGTNMAAVPLFRVTNMPALTSHENTLESCLIIAAISPSNLQRLVRPNLRKLR